MPISSLRGTYILVISGGSQVLFLRSLGGVGVFARVVKVLYHGIKTLGVLLPALGA